MTINDVLHYPGPCLFSVEMQFIASSCVLNFIPLILIQFLCFYVKEHLWERFCTVRNSAVISIFCIFVGLMCIS